MIWRTEYFLFFWINIPPSVAGPKTLSYLANTPKPRIVKLFLKATGQESFTVGSLVYFATRYDIHIQLGGLAGVIAPILSKQSRDLYCCVITGEVPILARMEGAFYQGGPVDHRASFSGVAWRVQ